MKKFQRALGVLLLCSPFILMVVVVGGREALIALGIGIVVTAVIFAGVCLVTD